MKLKISEQAAFSAPVVHKSGCDVLDLPQDEVDPLADITATRDEFIAYAITLRPHYDRINRVIGQLAGLFILAQSRGRFDADFDAVATPLEQAKACADALSRIRPPLAAKRQYGCIVRAMALISEVTNEFTLSLRSAGQVRERVAQWTSKLKRAHTLMGWASEQSLGLSAVDFGQACCSCGSAPKRPVR